MQDYHFLALGAELRELGVTGADRLLPAYALAAHSVMEGVPHHRELIEAMLAYDLIGFQTEERSRQFPRAMSEPIWSSPFTTTS